ncbi:MAG: hypothetical protein UEJ46_04380 [Eggerthellaceae bacterium]|nr:hypothetical protein [Eggerthellaceae bacterium]
MLNDKIQFLKIPAKNDLGICTGVFFAVDACLFGGNLWRAFVN